MQGDNFKLQNRNWTIPPELTGDDLLPGNTFEGYFLSELDQTKLCFGFYVPPNANGNAVVIEIGTGEHLGKYADTFHENARHGTATFLLEPRGHGLSDRLSPEDPARMSGWAFATMSHDSYQMNRDVVRPVMADYGFRNPNVTGLGVSQGAARLLFMERAYPGAYGQIILGAPMIGHYDMVRLHTNMEKRPERTISYLEKKFGVELRDPTARVPSQFEQISEDYIRDSHEAPALWHRYNPPESDSCLRANKVTMGFLRHGGAACVSLQSASFAPSITTPILTFIAEKRLGVTSLWRWGDDCVQNDKTIEFDSRAPKSTIVRMRPTDHDMLKESPEIRKGIFDIVYGEFLEDPEGFIDKNNAAISGMSRIFFSATADKPPEKPKHERIGLFTSQPGFSTPPQTESESQALVLSGA